MSDQTIHAVVFREGEWWVAQCLEVDLVAAKQRLEDLPAELSRLLTVQVAANRELGMQPFQGLPKAPRRFWEMFERAQARVLPVTEATGAQGFAFDARIAA